MWTNNIVDGNTYIYNKSPSANSPCKKSFFTGKPAKEINSSGVHMAILSKLNIDDLETSYG